MNNFIVKRNNLIKLLFKKKVMIPLLIILFFHIFNFFYFEIGKSNYEGAWTSESIRSENYHDKYIRIYRLDKNVLYNGKSYQYIVIGTEREDDKIGSLFNEILAFGNVENNKMISSSNEALILKNINTLEWKGKVYRRSHE